MVTLQHDNNNSIIESTLLLPSSSSTKKKPPQDTWNLAYIIYFTLGIGYLFPWNSFITAVDYFSYLYPQASVDRIFAIVSTLISLSGLFLIILNGHKSHAYVRINVGLALFVVSLVIVPLLDVVYVKGRVGLNNGFYVTVGAVGVSSVANALVQGSVVGSAGELPERYTQAVVVGNSASGILVSFLRIFTKAVYTQDASGLQKSANVYFFVSIVTMLICIVLYNVAQKLPVMKYYNELKIQAIAAEEDIGPLTGSVWRLTVWDTVRTIKWYGFGIMLIYVVTLAIFPGYITEDVHSQVLKDWYPILLITCFNVFDFVGKSLTAVYLLKNAKIAVGCCIVRLLFFPLFFGCLRGPKFFRTEISVTFLTCLLGLTNGYLTSVLMILAPKTVKLQHAEIAGIVSVLFLVFGLAVGSIVSWFWVI
ncbi:equilibrative nucleotide transporter 1-like [Vicia villosa]|uniref:equilibrative nucleotide transporter 1-like n=1 Tax=Vicia villosa TaxID=3911 RepID=UPI00273C2AC5|nr:equilibrative nucleotide transporter 1-like [Vicia villosa]